MRRDRGLTLVEMLVIVAMLAVMLGILLPAITRAQAMASRTVCLENLRSMGRAMDRWSAGHEGVFPRARYLASPIINSDPNPPLNVVLISQLSAVTDVFHCPGDAAWLYQTCGISYFYNFYLSGQRTDWIGTLINPGQSPAEVPTCWDADNTSFSTLRGTIEVPRFHEVRCSLFADGHSDVLADDATPFF